MARTGVAWDVSERWDWMVRSKAEEPQSDMVAVASAHGSAKYLPFRALGD